MVEWDFFCTGGNNSGKWSKIGVPSCWELQGFGTYQYGMKFYGKAFPAGVADEKGMYRYEFNLPAEWNGMHIRNRSPMHWLLSWPGCMVSVRRKSV